jgi:hypothetical protein
MNKKIVSIFLFLYGNHLYSQSINLANVTLIPVAVFDSIILKDTATIIRVVKDPALKEVDAASFVRLDNIDFGNGTIEVKVLSKLLPDAPDSARGFIGLAFHINKDNSLFESIYLRPLNARAPQQIRRNHSIQYFSYPNFKYNKLRVMAPGEYESYSDMSLNEWITIKIVIKDAQAQLFLNNNSQPSLIVNDLKNVSCKKGAIGLFVDIGTEGYFKDLKIQNK